MNHVYGGNARISSSSSTLRPVLTLATNLLTVNEREIERLARSDSRSWWIKGRRTLLGRAVGEHLVRAGPLVIGDIGCGAGGMFDVLKRFGRVVGVDISPYAAELARRKGYYGVTVASVVDLPLGACVFDMVVMADVIEHVEDDRRALRECARAMKPGAVLLVTVPALRWMYSDHDRALGHFRRYSRRDLEGLLSLCGFHVERMTYFNTLLFPLAMLFRLIAGFRRSAMPEVDPLDLANPWNWLAYNMLAAERFLISLVDLPFGLSLLGVCRKMTAAVGL